MSFMHFKLFWLIAAVISVSTFAAEPQPAVEPYQRFSSNEPNYFVGAWDNGDDWHMEFNLSIKYALWPPQASRHKLLFVYNGTYDFYLNSRDSAPIISRRQNIAPVYQYALGADPNRPEYEFRAGWYHESNGQTIETAEEYQDAGEFARDQVSRGWDYLGLEYRSPFFAGMRQHFDLRVFCDCQGWGSQDREDSIFWTSVNEQPKINDYDGIRWIMGDFELPADFGNLRLELKTGNRDFDALGNISGKFVFSDFLGFPLNIFYFSGYGRELSSYHERNQFIGIGIEMESF
tara:strand:- start:189559 stop:190428 length:870 start_codon:yes stop_codon:yes gene_type:complete